MKFDSIMEKVKDFGAAVLSACGPIALETAIAELQKLAGVKKVTVTPEVMKPQGASKAIAAATDAADEKPLPELPVQTEPAAPVKSKLTIEDLQARVAAGEGDVEGEDAKVRKSRKDAASSAKRMLAKLGAEVAAPAQVAEPPVKAPKKVASPAAVTPPAAPAKAGKFGKAPVAEKVPAKFISTLKVGQVIIITDPADDTQFKCKITEVQAGNNVVMVIAASGEDGAPSLDSDDFATLAVDPGPQPIEVLEDGSNVQLLTPKGAAVSKAAKKS